jgi:hypothetical protein
MLWLVYLVWQWKRLVVGYPFKNIEMCFVTKRVLWGPKIEEEVTGLENRGDRSLLRDLDRTAMKIQLKLNEGHN